MISLEDVIEDYRRQLGQALSERNEARQVAQDARHLLVEFEEDERVNYWFAINDELYPWLTGE